MRSWLQTFIVPADQADRTAAQWGRSFSTWVFNLARNVLVVGALRYIADRTHSLLVEIAYSICVVVLIIYISSYWQEWDVRLFSRRSTRLSAFVADLVVNVTIGLLIYFLSMRLIWDLATLLAKAH